MLSLIRNEIKQLKINKAIINTRIKILENKIKPKPKSKPTKDHTFPFLL